MTLPDLEPTGLEAAAKVIAGEDWDWPEPDGREEMRQAYMADAASAIRAYLAARSTAPEAGKAVDETAQDIIASTYIDGRNEPIGQLHALAILTHLEVAGYRVLASVPAPSGAEPKFDTRILPETQAALDAIDENIRSAAMRASTTFFGAPQAVPAEDIAGLIERLNATYNVWNNPPSDGLPDGANILIEAAADLTSLSAERDALAKGIESWQEDCSRYAGEMSAISAAIGSVRFMDQPDGGDVSLAEQVSRMRQALTASEAEATSLRKALETIRSMFEVEYHSDGRIASVGHASDGLRKMVIALDRTLSGASE